MENKIYYSIIDEYFHELKVKSFKIKIIETSDVRKAYYEIRPDQSSVDLGNIDAYNGHIVPPQNINKPFAILLNKPNMLKSKMNINYNWVGTIIHEATHILDFIEYRQPSNLSTFDELFDKDAHSLFNCWTEFHARAMGQYYVMKYRKKFGSNLATEKYIIETELPCVSNQLSTLLNSTKSAYDNAYLTMQLFGYLYSWAQDFPEYFSSTNIYKYFNGDVRYLRLFEFFKSHNTLNKVLSASNEMHTLMRTIYRDIPNTM